MLRHAPIVGFLVFLFAACAWAQIAQAQDAPTSAETDKLIETLKDPQRREELLRQLEILRQAQGQAPKEAAQPANGLEAVDHTIANALSSLTGKDEAANEATDAGAAPEGSGALVTLEEMVSEIRDNLEESWQWLGGLKDEIGQLDYTVNSRKFRAFWASLSWELLAILAGASLVGGITHFLLRRPTQRLLGHARTVTRLVWRNALGVVLKLLPAALFGLAGYVLVIALDLKPTPSLVAMALINAQTAVLLIMAVGSLDFAVARGRIMPDWFTDEATSFLRASILHLAITLSYGVMMIELAGAMGVDAALIRLLVHIVGFVTVAIALYTVYRLRRILALHEQVQEAQEIDAMAAGADNAAAAIATRSIAKAENSLRRNWASFATLAVLGFYMLWMVAPVEVLLFCLRGAILTILVTVFLRSLTRLIRRAFKRHLAEEGKQTWWSTGPWRRFQLYIDIFRRAILAILTVFAGILILQIWGVDFVAWLVSPVGQRLAGGLVTILLLIIGGIVLSELFSIAVESHLQKRSADYSDLSRRSRARTLLPLLRNVVRVALGTIITLLVLGEMGIQIGPLLAAAGVVGLAVGFGAQTLVKDIITGIFILIEDTIAVGDVVDLDGNSGVVESMTIRTVRLRDQAGTVHTVPFSAITKVMNMTRDFSYAVFEINIAYNQDIQQVIDVVQGVAAEMRKDPKFARDILEPIEILGLDRFADSAVVIKARIKTKPIRQWDVGRSFNWRLKDAFDAAGIEIPYPQRTMHIVAPKHLAEIAPPPEAPVKAT
ncbi:mechanosensitive ion channel family protein [Dongia sp.]|uniref:mechanosensitive ion channel family protein n=1 Tax=Dongia sp. TaxID=1977262 RepID=UPI0035B1297B